MKSVDYDSYEIIITALKNYLRDLEENCRKMEEAGHKCVNILNGGPDICEYNKDMQRCIMRIRETYEEVHAVLISLTIEHEYFETPPEI